MHKFIIQIKCLLTLSCKKRHSIRGFITNNVILYNDQGTEKRLFRNAIPGLKIEFAKNVTGNTIRIHSDAQWKSSHIHMRANNSDVEIGAIDIWTAPGLHININADTVSIVISNKTSFNGQCDIFANYKSNVFIGENCMFSGNVQIWATDYHTILNSDNRVINIPRGVHIGNHCWVGSNVCFTKNAYVSDGSVVGTCAVVGGHFDTNNVIIAGNPAKIIKHDIHWERELVSDYVSHH